MADKMDNLIDASKALMLEILRDQWRKLKPIERTQAATFMVELDAMFDQHQTRGMTRQSLKTCVMMISAMDMLSSTELEQLMSEFLNDGGN